MKNNDIIKVKKLLKESQINTLEFYKAIENNSYILDGIYIDKYNKKLKYILSNITYFATSKEVSPKIRKHFSILVKFANYARICSRISLTRGETIHMLYRYCNEDLLNDFCFIDFLLLMWEGKDHNATLDDIAKLVVNFFGDVLLSTNFKFSLSTIDMLRNIKTNMNLKEISHQIENNFNLISNEKIIIINKEIDTMINKFVTIFVSEIEPQFFNDEKH